MATNTYVALQTQVLGSAAASVTFSSIPQGYTDLMLVANYQPTAGSVCFLRVGNGSIDTGSTYSQTLMYGNGSSAGSARYSSQTATNVGPEVVSTPTTTWSGFTLQFQNYSNTTTYKTILSRYTDGLGGETNAKVHLWRGASNVAINTLTLYPNTGNFNTGSTFTLYAIQAA